MCEARPPNDPTSLRTESQRRRNSPPKPLRRRQRRRNEPDPLEWDKLESVPLVRSDASPESGEDYWVDPTVTLSDADPGKVRAKKKSIEPALKRKLKSEVVSPYSDNWILRAVVVVALLVLAVWKFGGLDTVPIITVPDL
ncbi:hypothetical protein BWQ96_07122 [Gracilariopsis chorda]|uniref:Uncharacterized protein n=1 Tax=Gracilariopsis chorda TaxID=448386 RepID=A0A2V3IM79_9FLOR|nr:hypothetical protein BWQ96_07122 [Gracilariopsis chorda]|eukprot:PXF43178.1 hypothetical protein BWQ96_07122 [Gracilariopsis chorda]